MQSEQPIVVCAFGWGQEFRLYQDHLCVDGNNYALRELTSVHPIYRQFMGIPSARLELLFGQRKLVLRGIASVEYAKEAVQYLTQWCRLPSPQAELLNVSALLRSMTRVKDSKQKNTDEPLSRPALQEFDSVIQESLSFNALAQAVTVPIATPHWEYIANIEMEDPDTKDSLSARRKRQLRKEQAQFDRFLEEDTLPTVAVPVRLQPGEHAHYSTDATLCGERIGESIRYTYPALDHGTLILTNKRMIYIGRRSQIVLDYMHFLHISRLRGAVAFEADHWNKRVIFEVRDPLECTMYTKCILQRFQQEVLITVSGEERISRGDDRHIDGIVEQRVW